MDTGTTRSPTASTGAADDGTATPGPTDDVSTTPGPTGDAPGSRDRLPLAALVTANVISAIGNSVSALAIPWFVLQTTGSAARMGIVAAAGMIPFILSSVFGGALVDRIGHKRASVIADVSSGLTVAAIPLCHATVGLPFWLLLVLVFAGSLLDAPGSAAQVALVPDIAGRARVSLERVNGLTQSMVNVSRLAGPLIAGTLIAAVGASAVLWIDAASFAISAALVGRFVPSIARPAAAGEGSYRENLVAGWRVLWSDRPLRGIALTAVVTNAVGAPLGGVILPLYAAATYGTARSFGVMVAGIGAGALLGAVAFGAIGDRLPHRPTLAVGFSIGFVPLTVLLLEPSLPVAVMALFTGAAAGGVINPLVVTIFHRRVPPAFQARAFGTLVGLAMVAAPLGVLVAGSLVEAVGVNPILAMIVGIGSLTGLLILAHPAFAGLGSATPPAPATPEPGIGVSGP
ncbi:MAG: MFS transporter [Thermomicrobiales bacterium]